MKKFALVAILLFFPLQSWALCTVEGYTVIYVNGIFTTEDQARYEMKDLEDRFKIQTGKRDVKFVPGYNPTHLAGGGDLVKSIQQAYEDEDSYIKDFDLQTILLKTEPDVKTRKILLVGYSQGTFYTNALYQYLVENGVPRESISVYNIGTPASYVAGGGAYLTSANDMLIYEVRRKTAFGGAKKPLDSNILIPPVEENPAPKYLGHSLKDVYLPKATVRIVSEMQRALDTLEATVPSDGGCFTPPPVTTDYKVKQASFAFFDPVAETARNGTTAFYQGAKYAVGTLQDGLNALGSAVRSLLPKADTATAIDAFDVVRNIYGSSLSKEDLLELNSSASSVKGTVAQKTNPPQAFPYMGKPEEGVLITEEPKKEKVSGAVLGEFIQIPPSFAPVTPNGPLVGGGGGGSPPAQEPTPQPAPAAVAPAPVSELSITTPTENETTATTTVTVSGIAPKDTPVEISDGTSTTTVTSGATGLWSAEMVFTEGVVALSVSAFEIPFLATTSVTRSFTIDLPCVEPSAATLGQTINESWTPDNSPYVIDGAVSVRNGSLSIAPGTIVKFKPGATLSIHADVAVNVAGTASSPVIFTSIKDDSAGGDTNCDDTATSPSAGDWGYMSFGEGSWNSNLSLAYTKIRYGGGATYRGVSPALAITYMRFSGSPGIPYALQTLNVSESAHTGLYLYLVGTNELTISNSSFTNNASYGVYRDDSAGPFPGKLYLDGNWWGDTSGPLHSTLNPTGIGNGIIASVSIADVFLASWLSAAPW